MRGVPFLPDRWLVEGDTVTVGDLVLDVYETPGHTPGHVIFHHPESKLALVGDVLFQGSVGRTDFPRSDHAALIRSIVDKLWPLGGDTAFIPGHGGDEHLRARTRRPTCSSATRRWPPNALAGTASVCGRFGAWPMS